MPIWRNEAKELGAEINSQVAKLSAILQCFPKGNMGLTPDNVRSSPEYHNVKAKFDEAFADLRKFNAAFTKVFARDIKAERRARRVV